MGRVLLSLLLVAFISHAQEKQIRRVSLEPTSMTSGRQMFQAYCASCHGVSGRGDGPAAAALSHEPADLTRLQRDHRGKFPSAYVSAKLKNVDWPSHDDKDMPGWASLLSSVSRDGMEMQLRIANLVSYIESIQAR